MKNEHLTKELRERIEEGIRHNEKLKDIAKAFYRNTNIVVLDEATSALDYETEKNILDHVTEYSKDHTLIIITHRLNTIESCDYINKIEEGKIQCVKSKYYF